jgi:hypothetical protein
MGLLLLLLLLLVLLLLLLLSRSWGASLHPPADGLPAAFVVRTCKVLSVERVTVLLPP